MTEAYIAHAIANSYRNRWHYRKMIVVANVSWGMGVHECDLLGVTTAGYAHEIEIKISRADLRADQKKTHGHDNRKIKYLWFAGPEYLTQDLIELAPERAGIIIIREREHGPLVVEIRQALARPYAAKWDSAQKYNLARLGTMRYWSRKK